MRSHQKLASVLLASMCLSINPLTSLTSLAAQDISAADFSLYALGPGRENLSLGDRYASYQWGLKNDGDLAYAEIKNRFEDIDTNFARAIDTANRIGIPAPVEGPGAYQVSTTASVPGIDINILPAWNYYEESTTPRRPVIVAVIDTGIDFSHPELANAAWVNEDEIPGDGIDNDGNGYIDDINGWNFFNNNNQLYVGTEDDHGTHAAGTIAANRHADGIAGITDNNYVKIMSVKALGTEYGVGDVDTVINAINYAEANGASICNLSFGTQTNYPQLEETIRNSKMLFVVSAGNGDSQDIGYSIDEKPAYPASYDCDNIISVANLFFDGNLHSSSNYGPVNVDIAAPGTYIVSTTTNNSYGFMSGTSMSAPMVTGLAAMLYSFRTDLNLSDIKPLLLNSARRLDTLSGKVTSGGIPNAYAALTWGLQ